MPQTQAQQIAQIINDLASLRKEHDDAIVAMRTQVSKIEERMQTYEDKQEESTLLLKAQSSVLHDVQLTVNTYDSNIQNFMTFLKKSMKVVGTVAIGVLIIVLAASILAFWHVHP